MRWNLYCRLDDSNLGTVLAEHAPRIGDVIGYTAPDWTPFDGHHTWRVDTVVWNVSPPGSVWSMDRIRAGKQIGQDGTVVETVDVFVWPDRGPYWPETPEWAARLHPEEDDDDAGSTDAG